MSNIAKAKLYKEAFDLLKQAQELLIAARKKHEQQPAEGEEIMVNTPYDVFTLPLRPSGLSSGPRFVVHVPGPKARGMVDGCHCATCTCNPGMTPAIRFDTSPAAQEGAVRDPDTIRELLAERDALLDALRQIAEWPDGGNRYGQWNIKRFAQDVIDARELEDPVTAEQCAWFVAEIKRLRTENERLHEQLRLATVDQAIAEAEASDAHAENKRLAEALRDAATSMQTIADKAGRDEYLMTMGEVRGYANSRANAARAALEQEGRR